MHFQAKHWVVLWKKLVITLSSSMTHQAVELVTIYNHR